MKKEELNYPENPLTENELTSIRVKQLNAPVSVTKSFKSIFHEVLIKLDCIKTSDGVITYKHEKWKTVRDNVKLFQHYADTWNKSVVGSDVSEMNKYYSVYVLACDDNQERISELFDFSRTIDKRA